jgi:signal recognition particle receptor subunit beta
MSTGKTISVIGPARSGKATMIGALIYKVTGDFCKLQTLSSQDAVRPGFADHRDAGEEQR